MHVRRPWLAQRDVVSNRLTGVNSKFRLVPLRATGAEFAPALTPGSNGISSILRGSLARAPTLALKSNPRY